MEFTLTFIRIFFKDIFLAAPLVISFFFFILLLGQIVGRIEGWSRFNAAYWSFITALTVGYGDIRPLKKFTKTLAVVIALTGLMFSGILVAITVNSATVTFTEYMEKQNIITMQEK